MGASGSKGVAITGHDRAILDLKVQRDRIKQYQRKLLVVSARETAAAKAWVLKGDKRRALVALKKKKFQESLVATADMQLLTLEQMCDTIEFALIERDLFEGLKQGNQVLKQLHAEMDVDKVQQLMDDTHDAIQYQNEIVELLGGKLSDADMEEIEEELDALVAAELDAMPAIPVNSLPIPEREPAAQTIEFPEVPSALPVVPEHARAKAKEEQQLEEAMLAS
ncbi:Snf7 family [Chytriomyces sp. MP71]|nr:Snf7 family [Chytriomyces sp. MP71]